MLSTKKENPKILSHLNCFIAKHFPGDSPNDSQLIDVTRLLRLFESNSSFKVIITSVLLVQTKRTLFLEHTTLLPFYVKTI
jgi:hypothetical protein